MCVAVKKTLSLSKLNQFTYIMETTRKIKWYKRTIALLTLTTILPTSLLLMSQVIPTANAPANQEKKSQSITAGEASKYISNYAATAEKTKAVIKGVVIDDGQLEALNEVAAANPTASSYRLYFGKDDAGADVAITVAMDATGKDQTENMYTTARTGTNLCPPMCDAAGTLTGGN